MVKGALPMLRCGCLWRGGRGTGESVSTLSKKAEVLVLGGGPAGATAAIRLLAKGLRPLIVESQVFPRYHIGESMTGECGAIVRELGFGERMEAAGHQHKCGVNV